MIVRADGRPARKRVVEMSANPTLFAFLMTGDPMKMFSDNGLLLRCRNPHCNEPIMASNHGDDGTWRVECSCTEWRCSSRAAAHHRLVGAH
jgi:hypothetical protein